MICLLGVLPDFQMLVVVVVSVSRCWSFTACRVSAGLILVFLLRQETLRRVFQPSTGKREEF